MREGKEGEGYGGEREGGPTGAKRRVRGTSILCDLLWPPREGREGGGVWKDGGGAMRVRRAGEGGYVSGE